MRKVLIFLAAIAFFCAGCGDSGDEFVFTNNNINNGQVGIPAQLVFVTNPAQTTNTDFSVAPVVEVRDALGNRVTSDNSTVVTVSLVNPGGAVLSGTTTRTVVQGQAAFPGLSVDQPGTFTLQASAGTLTAGSSQTFTVAARVALYAVASASGEADPERLVELNPANGQLVGVLGDIGDRTAFEFISDIVCLPDGRMLGVAFDMGGNPLVLINIDPSNPVASSTIATIDDGTTYDRVFGLAYDANTSTLYGLARDAGNNNAIVVTINTTTGAPTPLPNPTGVQGGGAGSSGMGLAFDANSNTLFMTRGNDLHSINIATGVATLLGGGGTNALDVRGTRGLDFHPTSGVLYGAGRGTSGAIFNLSQLGTLNTTTGASTVLGSGVGISGLSFCENAPVGAATMPRQTGYTVESITQAFVDISGTGFNLGLGDDNSSNGPIGFTFNFNGTDYTTISISANGYATFENVATNNPGTRYLLPDVQLDDNSLSVWFDDLDPGLGGDVFVETRGTAPNRTFVAQWSQVRHVNAGNNGIDAELILYEGSNVIEYHYSDVVFGDTNVDAGQSAQVGVQISSTVADLWSGFNAVLTNTTAIRFTP